MTLFAHRFETPIGPIVTAVDEGGAVHRLDLLRETDAVDPAAWEARVTPRLGALVWDGGESAAAKVVEQVAAYFAGERRSFELELTPTGTEFQTTVWTELTRIPFGATISYAELARRVGNPKAVRAVGRANGSNPISIIVPCHRVIGSDGSLTGYASGVEHKRALLEHEGVLLPLGA